MVDKTACSPTLGTMEITQRLKQSSSPTDNNSLRANNTSQETPGLGVLSPLEPLLAGEGGASALRIPMINAVSSMVSAVTAILGGYWLINYQRRGVQLIILGILMSSALAFLTFFLGEDGGLGELLGDESAAFGILSVTQAIVTVVCGLIAAIPILTSSVGLDRSSLFSGLK